MSTAELPEPDDWTRPEFPPLVVPTTPSGRRERWWYSDGAWINQGSTSAVVGAVWTHWLADCMIDAGRTLDEEFATELFYDSQRQTGVEPDDQAGAQLTAAAQVLNERDLIEGCFQCPDLDSLIYALLERGPVLAGLAWREMMFKPVRVDGVPVCRVEPDSPIVGGHAVLLNGISLDLELGGAKGFIRFKNSWDRAWGENGLCLISIDDLDQLFADGEFLFPVAGAQTVTQRLDPEVPPEDETAKVSPEGAAAPALADDEESEVVGESEAVRYEQEAIGSDIWTTDDEVGYGIYAEAIARGIQHDETRPPLTVGIKAPWGAGKTSLMRMVQQRLEWPGTWRTARPRLREIRLLSGPGEYTQLLPASWRGRKSNVTNGTLLRRLWQNPPEPRDLVAAPRPESRAASGTESLWRPTVWFNPWMYQTSEQVWAGFAHEIIKQITERMRRGDRERFWLELNLRRVDEHAVRRKIYALVFQRLLPWTIAGLLVLAAGIALLVTDVASSLGSVLTLSGPALFVIASLFRGVSVLRADVGGSLAAVVKPALDARQFADSQLAGSFDRLVPDPKYAAAGGVFHLLHTDIQRVIDLVATESRPLVIFIDDLDRCSPGTVVQVIEAINLFLAGEFRNAIFVIAVEPELVAAHIEAAYGDLVAKMEALSGPARASEVLGWRFLEKIIQLPLTLPLIEHDRAQGFVGSLFPSDELPPEEPASEVAEPVAEQTEAAAAIAAAEQMLVQRSLGEAVRSAQKYQSQSIVGEALRRAVARKLSRDDEEMRAVINYGAQVLRPNPREIKRFANVFRFLVTIATERSLAELEAPSDLQVLAKLAVVTTRWPSVIAHLNVRLAGTDARTVFELLENPPESRAEDDRARAAEVRDELEQALTSAGVSPMATQRLLADDLRDVMQAEPRIAAYARDWL